MSAKSFLKIRLPGFSKCVVNPHCIGEFKVWSIYLPGSGICAVYAGNLLWSLVRDRGEGPLATVFHVVVMIAG